MSTAPARPLTILEEMARKHKLPTVMELLNKSLQEMKVTYLARELQIDYTNLYKVIRDRRRLPLTQTVLLARLHGFNEVDALFMHAFQEMEGDTEIIKNQRPVKKSVLAKESSELIKKTAKPRATAKAATKKTTSKA